MSPPLTYRPVYLGLFASLVLAMACNVFLDIQYGSFTIEVLLWAGLFGYTLRVGWKQRGQTGDHGRRRQKVILIGGAILGVIFFIPVWGFPRAGLYLLGILQAAQNCVTTVRRNLHLGILVSMVMVMFAASHFRADWTMLFYLVPYIMAVVFTLVAEQISRRVEDLHRDPENAHAIGQGAAIATATAAILLAGGALYAVTPQASWGTLFWNHGQPGSIGLAGQTHENGPGAAASDSGGHGDAGEPGYGAGDRADTARRGRWPTLGEMREAARRTGMPQWQASAINTLADLIEYADGVLAPIRQGLAELWDELKQWLNEHRKAIAQSLLALLFLALLAAAWRLLREARPGIWLRTRLDYLRFGILAGHAPGNAGARQYYSALERLLDLEGVERALTANAREHLAQICRHFAGLRPESVEFTLLFERARYGDGTLLQSDLHRMRALYRQIFRRLRQMP